MDPYNVALIGKTGHGKSSTGNTILRRNIFATTDTSVGGSDLVVRESTKFNNIVVKVYDTPGLMDSDSTEKEDKIKGRRNMDTMMDAAKTLDALILVYKYNTTFSKEESKTIDILEEFFGKTCLSKHGFIVITCGDVLDRDMPKGETRDQFFSKWCAKQKPLFRQLMEKVNKRIVLVNNTGDFSELSKRLSSSKEILNMISQLKEANGVYTKTDYEYQKRWCTIL